MASSPQQPITLQTGAADPGDTEILELTKQVQEGQLDGLRQYLLRTRAERDWQDRLYILERVAPKASIDLLDSACASEPEAADLLVVRCAYYAELSKTMRGGGTSDQVGKVKFQNAAECVKAALADLEKSAQLDDQDPTCHTLILAPLSIFGQHKLQQRSFEKATAIAPDLVPAHLEITTSLSERWGGSHRASLEVARKALTLGGAGSDMAACLFWAHWLVQNHFATFDKNPGTANLYKRNKDVRNELDVAFDNWVAPPYAARRSSIPFLRKASSWYRLVLDGVRFEKAISFTKEASDPRMPSWANLPTMPTSASSSTTGGGWLGRIFGSGSKR